jgi:hypothetical protein
MSWLARRPWPIRRLPLWQHIRDNVGVDDELVTREELTATLFSIADIREDVRKIKRILEENDGEAQEDDA